MRSRYVVAWLAFLFTGLLADPAFAIPAFARRHETACGTCHQFHYPRLNAYGRRFRENGYQLPDGGEEEARARRMVEPGTVAEKLSIFKEVPLSVRAQVFGLSFPNGDKPKQPVYENRLFSFLQGGGSIDKDISFFFSWTPFPITDLHQARVGFHNIGEDLIGPGSLNVRAGAFFLLDFQRPSHRSLAPGFNAFGNTVVGDNNFALEGLQLGVEAYGRPFWGPLLYEVALVGGDPGLEQTDRDNWKDLFGRLSYTFFQNSNHEVTIGALGYAGRSESKSDLGGVEITRRDDFWLAGGDIEFDVGPLNVNGIFYYRHHDDPFPQGGSAAYIAARGQATWGITRRWIASVGYEDVRSDDINGIDTQKVSPHLTFVLRRNVLLTAVWRQDLLETNDSSAVAVIDTTF